MFSTSSRAQRARRAAIVAGAVGLVAAAAVTAPQAFGTAADTPAGSESRVQQTTAVAEAEASDAEVTHEQGVALAGFGDLNGRQVFVEIYGNSLYGSQATVVVEQPGGPELSASLELAADDLLDGDVELDVALSRNTRGGLAPTRSRAQIDGTWDVSGESTKIDETFEDAGYLIHTTGTNTPLAADVVVTIDGKEIAVEMQDAFAFDLTVTRTAL
jgi:hypothetical protein